MDALPDEVLLSILELVDYKDLARCSQVNKRLSSLALTEKLWSDLYRRYWGSSEQKDSGKEPIDCFSEFGEMFSQFGEYIDHYKRINNCWIQILEFCRKNLSSNADSFLPPLSKEGVKEMNSQWEGKIPKDLLCFYRLCGGQDSSQNIPGFFTSFEDAKGLRFRRLVKPHEAMVVTDSGAFPVAVPLSCAKQSGDGKLKRIEAIPLCYSDLPTNLPLESWSNPWLALEGNLRGCVFWIQHIILKQNSPVYVVSRSFTEYLESFVADLSVCPLENGRLLCQRPNNSCRTGPFLVKVAVRQCIPGPYGARTTFYTYRITMSMDEDGDPNESSQLETRHWNIIEESGVESRVDGPGVVGEFPVMRPGASFSWMSGTSFTPPAARGTMKGYFMMRNLLTGLQQRIECADMHFEPEGEIHKLEIDPLLFGP